MQLIKKRYVKANPLSALPQCRTWEAKGIQLGSVSIESREGSHVAKRSIQRIGPFFSQGNYSWLEVYMQAAFRTDELLSEYGTLYLDNAFLGPVVSARLSCLHL